MRYHLWLYFQGFALAFKSASREFSSQECISRKSFFTWQKLLKGALRMKLGDDDALSVQFEKQTKLGGKNCMKPYL